MAAAQVLRPEAGDYADYYAMYVEKVPDGDILATLENQAADAGFLRGLGPEAGDHRYEAGKWSIKEVVGHITDTERVFSYRQLRIARNDGAALNGFDQDDWMTHSGFAERSLDDLLDEWEQTRANSLCLLRTFTPEMIERSGMADGKRVSLRMITWLLAGHAQHHFEVLRERYL